MKKVVNVNLGGRAFVVDDDAYYRLKSYLEEFRNKSQQMGSQASEIMEDVESRVAELFLEQVKNPNIVVTIALVEHVIAIMGMPDGSPEDGQESSRGYYNTSKSERKLFRDKDSKLLGGICSGLAHFLDIDVVFVRVALVVLAWFWGTGILLYMILWILVPQAYTPVEKCQMRGIPITPENISNFSKDFNHGN